MAIPVTTRSGKGSPLTQAEMDTNLTELARSATELEEGNIEIATSDETEALTDLVKAVVPGNLGVGIEAYLVDLGQSLANEGSYTFPGGLTIKWGRTNAVTGASGQVETVTFAEPFPTALFQVIVGGSHLINGTSTYGTPFVSSKSLTSFTVVFTSFGLSNVTDSSASWIAIGN